MKASKHKGQIVTEVCYCKFKEKNPTLKDGPVMDMTTYTETKIYVQTYLPVDI